MSSGAATCPGCGLAATRKNGRDRHGRQIHQCRSCRRHCTILTGTPFAGDRSRPTSSPSPSAGTCGSAGATPTSRHSSPSAASTLTRRRSMAGCANSPRCTRTSRPPSAAVSGAPGASTGPPPAWSARRSTSPAPSTRASDARPQTRPPSPAFRRAIAATGVALDEVTTDCAIAYPPALAAVLPSALHETGKAVQQRIERDHQHRKGRLRPLRGCETLVGATMLCAGHASLRNLRGGFYDFGRPVDAASAATRPPVVQAWAAPTGVLLAW